MPTIALTQPAVEKLKAPAKGRVEYWDKLLPGFGLRISDRGRRSWIVLYRVRGKLIRETLGTTALLPRLGEARDLARASLQKAKEGINPVEIKRDAVKAANAEARAEEARQRDTLDKILDRYLAEYGAKRWRPDTLKEISRAFEADVRPRLGARCARDIGRRDIRELLDAIAARGRAPHAHHLLAYLRPALDWAAEREIITGNPAAGIPDPDPRRREARTRDRYLDNDEIRLFWSACEAIGWPFGPLFKLLLLTGQRRDELAQAPWSEFDLGKALWVLPRGRSKNDKEHVIHLAPRAVEIIEALPTKGKGGWLFTTNGDRPVSGFGRGRVRLVTAMEERQAELIAAAGGGIESAAGAIEIAHFTLHDLRRSTATGMAGLGIAHHVVDRVLNHVGGTIRGVARIYNRFEYLDERKAALETWAGHIDGLVSPRPSNVVQLAGAR